MSVLADPAAVSPLVRARWAARRRAAGRAPQPHARPPRPGEADRRDAAAADVRRAVRVRVRERDPRPGGDYREYLMAGIFVQTLAFGVMGTAVGWRDMTRASSTASARCRWPARPCWSGARSPTWPRPCSRSSCSPRQRAARRLDGRCLRGVGGGRLRPAAPVRLRDDVGRRAARRRRARRRGGAGRRVRRDVPAHVPGQHVRRHARAAGGAARDRRVEPAQRGGRGRARSVGQPVRRDRPTSPGRSRTRSRSRSAGASRSCSSRSRSRCGGTGGRALRCGARRRRSSARSAVNGGIEERDEARRRSRATTCAHIRAQVVARR